MLVMGHGGQRCGQTATPGAGAQEISEPDDGAVCARFFGVTADDALAFSRGNTDRGRKDGGAEVPGSADTRLDGLGTRSLRAPSSAVPHGRGGVVGDQNGARVERRRRSSSELDDLIPSDHCPAVPDSEDILGERENGLGNASDDAEEQRRTGNPSARPRAIAMPSSILPPQTFINPQFGPPPNGNARIVVSSSQPITVHVMSYANLEHLRNGQPFVAFGTDMVGPGNELDALVQIPFMDWYLVLVNRGNADAATYYEVYS